MAETITLKTRLLNKYENASAGLLKGEINFLPATMKDGDKDLVIMQVGADNNGTIKEFAAKASDVYAWAKKAGLTISSDGKGGNVVSGIEWDETLNNGAGGIRFTTAAVATSEGLADLQGRVGAIEGKPAQNITEEQITNWEKEIGAKDLASGKANAEHTHKIADVTGLEDALDGKAATSHGTHVTFSTTAPVADGTASAGTATTVARSDHRHPTDTSRASQVDLSTHTGNTTVHITSAERVNWNKAYDHSESNHAPANAQANVIETIKVNGSALTPSSKAVNITVPTKVSDLSNDSKYLVASDIANKADKGTTLAEYGIADAMTEVEILAAIKEAKDEAIGADTNTTYSISYDSTTKKIILTGSDKTTTDIDATDFVKDGMISEVKLENNNLIITWNTDAEKSATTIPLSHLIDVYTVKNTDTVDMTITDNVISADVKTASITETYLSTSVNASLDLADSALQKADITTGTSNGAISVEGTDVKVKGLKSAAYTDSTAYAKASEGLKSVTAGNGLVATFANNALNISIKDSTSDFVFILDANA